MPSLAGTVATSLPTYRVNYTNSDGIRMSTTVFAAIRTTLTDLTPNTTYTVVVEALTPAEEVFRTSEPNMFSTGL